MSPELQTIGVNSSQLITYSRRNQRKTATLEVDPGEDRAGNVAVTHLASPSAGTEYGVARESIRHPLEHAPLASRSMHAALQQNKLTERFTFSAATRRRPEETNCKTKKADADGKTRHRHVILTVETGQRSRYVSRKQNATLSKQTKTQIASN